RAKKGGTPASAPTRTPDAAEVRTRTPDAAEGWRDVKVAVFDRRQRSEPTTATEWDERDLPAPTVRSVLAAVEQAKDFGERCAEEAERLALTDPGQLSVLGDGAEWIWNVSATHFPGVFELLDIWHGAEAIGDGIFNWSGCSSPMVLVLSCPGARSAA